MYLKLGTIGVNYSTPEIDDFMIYSEVPDSSISYESPILVRTLEELEIWFGKSMLDYPMLVEILNHGGVLYLYGPTSVEDRESGIINISGYNEVWFDSNEEIPIPETLMNSVPIYENVKYRVSEENGQTEWWIWKEGAWLKESQFPQNLSNSSVSLNNRDTLFLSVVERKRIDDFYWYSSDNLKKNETVYRKDEDGNIIRVTSGLYQIGGVSVSINKNGKVQSPANLNIPGIEDPEVYTSNPRYSEDREDKLEEPFNPDDPRRNIIIEPRSKGNTYSLKITYPETQEPEDVSLGNGFFLYTNSSGKVRCILYGDKTEGDIKYEYGIDLNESGIETQGGIENLQALINILCDQGEGNDALEEYRKGPGEIILHVKAPTGSIRIAKGKFTFSGHFISSNPDLNITIDEDTNSQLLDQYIRSSHWPGILFWSRTIGRDSDIYDDSRDISINTEELEDGEYLVKISRYDYSEYFTGRWGDIERGESLENKINQESKLIRCSIVNSDSEIRLPEGETYKLSGAVENKSDPGSSFWKSLYTLLDPPGETVCPDFFLIPYLYYYEGRDDKELIGLAEKYNTQFVISEKYPYQLEKNLTGEEDRENRVMYFYGDLQINDVRFPAAYPFLIGVLENSSIYTAKLLKNTIGKDVDYNTLDEKKCNYLESNNQRYFYKKYNSGDNYITTAWRRFLIGKISRELEKNKWNYLGTRYTGIIKNRIEEVLSRVKNNFSMIRDIQISKFLPDPQSQIINMTIDIETTDLVDNHIELDILINYNKRYE